MCLVHHEVAKGSILTQVLASLLVKADAFFHLKPFFDINLH